MILGIHSFKRKMKNGRNWNDLFIISRFRYSNYILDGQLLAVFSGVRHSENIYKSH